jgi:hypothetical protein
LSKTLAALFGYLAQGKQANPSSFRPKNVRGQESAMPTTLDVFDARD